MRGQQAARGEPGTTCQDDRQNARRRELGSTPGQGAHRLLTVVMLVLLPLGAMAQDPVVGATVRADSPIDQRLGKAVVGALERSENVAVRGLVATVDEGIVTLEGAVRTSAEKHLASRYARDVAGIQGVVNAITVEPAIGVP